MSTDNDKANTLKVALHTMDNAFEMMREYLIHADRPLKQEELETLKELLRRSMNQYHAIRDYYASLSLQQARYLQHHSLSGYGQERGITPPPRLMPHSSG